MSNTENPEKIVADALFKKAAAGDIKAITSIFSNRALARLDKLRKEIKAYSLEEIMSVLKERYEVYNIAEELTDYGNDLDAVDDFQDVIASSEGMDMGEEDY